jgi:PAS domain S-box-containing protein
LPEPERAGGDRGRDPRVPLTDHADLLAESAEELYEQAPVAYVSSLLDGTIVRVNATLERWLGYERDAVVGHKRFHDLLAPGARIYYETHYAPLLQMQGEVREIAAELVRADGSRLPVLLNSTLVGGEDGSQIVRTTAFDASDRRRYERELLRARADAESRARSAVALEHVNDGVVLVDRKGCVEVMNPAAERILAVNAPAVIGRLASEVIDGWDGVAAAVTVGGSGDAQAAVIPSQRGQHEQWLAVAAVDAGDAVVYTIRDVTAERRLDQLRSEVVTTVSHELRTPLTAAYGSAKTLHSRYDQLDDASRRVLVQMLVEQTQRLTRIVEQILFVSQLDTDNAPDAAVAEFDAADAFDPLLVGIPQDARTRIVVDVGPGTRVRGDLDAVRQALTSLVDNALKYSRGAVRLSVERRDFSARLCVADDGPGIPDAERDRIFDKFYRLDPDQQSGVGGTGLGLYIARSLVARMGGRLDVLPRDRGATFYIDLPLA